MEKIATFITTQRNQWIPLAGLLVMALALRTSLEPWAFMWLIALSVFFGCKWLTWKRALTEGVSTNDLRVMAYCLAWVGMDAEKFLDIDSNPAKPKLREWIMPMVYFILGVILIWKIARIFYPAYPLLSGWLGLIGMGFLFHFGSFQILSLFWRQLGVNAQPFLNSPYRAVSLADFWGKRWNMAFRRLSHDFIFEPLRHKLNLSMAMFPTFLVSGLLHEAIISLPVNAGYGSPTLYFFLQWMGIVIERSKRGRGAGFSKGWRGRIFTIVFVLGPFYRLFHEPFVTGVILPFLRVIHSL